MKIHASLANAVIKSLEEIFIANRKADKVLAETLRSNPKWGSRDRGFIAENTYEIVRWWRLLHFINGTEINDYKSKTLWHLLGISIYLKTDEMPFMAEFNAINKDIIKSKYHQAQEIRKIKESIPDWLDELGVKELGEQLWTAEIAAMNEHAPVALRANTLQNSREELRAFLSKDDIEVVDVQGLDDALYLDKRQNIFRTDAFKDGRFEVQDPGSQLISTKLQVAPGTRVIDACAGAGGKSLHLAALMQNKGHIISLDIEQWKLDELKKRARRNKAHNIETRLIEGKVIKRLKDGADRLLLDVPCTGLGTLRRNPDAKWKLDPTFLSTIKQVQKDILSQYASMLRKEGLMVYATCSVLPSEGEEQVVDFLQKNTNFELLEEQRTSPAKDGFDAFYMAVIKRNS